MSDDQKKLDEIKRTFAERREQIDSAMETLREMGSRDLPIDAEQFAKLAQEAREQAAAPVHVVTRPVSIHALRA